MKINRLLTMLWAEIRCNLYLSWAGGLRGECLFVGDGKDGKRSIIGTATGSMLDNTLKIRRVFWCENREENT